MMTRMARMSCLSLLAAGAAAAAEPPAPTPARDANWPAGLRGTTFVVLDLETTGLSRTRDRVVEAAAVRLRDGRILDSRCWLINPGRPIPAAATAVHGIRDADVRQAPAFAAVYPRIAAYIGDGVVVAHNAPFDAGFLVCEAVRGGGPVLTNTWLDSLALCRRLYPEAKRHNLESMARRFRVKPRRYHRAGDDADTLARVLAAVIRTLPPDLDLPGLTALAGGRLDIQRFVPADGAPADAAR